MNFIRTKTRKMDDIHIVLTVVLSIEENIEKIEKHMTSNATQLKNIKKIEEGNNQQRNIRLNNVQN